MPPEPRKSKDEVDYSEGTKHAHCGICRHYLSDRYGLKWLGECGLVAGSISPMMWCRLFSKDHTARV